MKIPPETDRAEPAPAPVSIVDPPVAEAGWPVERAAAAPRRRAWRRVRAVVLLVVFAGAAAAGAWYWKGLAEPLPARVATAPVERGDIEDSTTALGTLQPFEFVDVGTQVSGQLRKFHVEVGAAVAQGDLLAEIDPTIYQTRVESARAQLLNLRAQLADRQAQLDLARQQFQRQSNLMRANATSQDALQSAEAAMRSAAAQVEALKAQIQNTESVLRGDEANLGYTKIRAPMSGTVVSQTARQGQTLNASQQAPIIMRVADLSTMTVRTQVSEADVGRLKLGMDAYFTTLGRPDRRWQGKLRKIMPTPEVVNNVVLYDALFDVPNPTGELMTQMTAQVFFVSAAAKDVLLVPVAALKPAERRPDRTGAAGRPGGGEKGSPRGRQVVQVLRDDGTLEEREVRVGITNRVTAEIVSGLAEGERVVIGRPTPAAPANRPGFTRPARLS